MSKYTFKVGDRVYWTDPGDDVSSGPGRIETIVMPEGEKIDEDTIIALSLDSGGEAEVLPKELTPLKEMSQCFDCERYWRENELADVHKAWERVQPGDTMPDGQCPECGGLCYTVEEHTVWLGLHDSIGLWTVEEFSFSTLSELNAFLRGLEVGTQEGLADFTQFNSKAEARIALKAAKAKRSDVEENWEDEVDDDLTQEEMDDD